MPDVQRDGGSADMNTEATEAAMQRIRTAATTFKGTLGGLDGRIRQLQGGLGHGSTAESWPENYNVGAANQILDAVKTLDQPVTKAADAGSRTVADYLKTDAENRKAIDNAQD